MKKFLILITTIFLTVLGCSAQTMNVHSERGVVLNVEYVDLGDDVAQVKQLSEVKILTGEKKGEVIIVDNMLTGNPYYDINLKKGSKVVLHVEEDGDSSEFYLESLYRANAITFLMLLFALILVLVGRKKGLYSLISIIITCLLIVYLLSPMILFGIHPIFSVVLVSLLSTATTMYLVGGFNKKSTSATIGCVLSLIVAGLLAILTVKVANLTGFNDEQTIFLYAAHPELNFIGIAISIMILATLGAVMDVAMSIASTINEIFELDNTKTVKELFKSGMNVGRDIIGTMANTLILVYIGGSLPLLLLAANIDFQKFVNLNQVVTEISSALIGSIAIVICVPITAIVAANLVRKQTVKVDLKQIDA